MRAGGSAASAPGSAAPAAQHIAVVVNDLRGYGAQRVALDLAGELASQGHRVTIVTLEDPSPDEVEPARGVGRVALRRSGHGALSYVAMALALRRALADLRPDGVISHMTFSNLVSLLGTPRGTPVLATEHNVLTRNLTIERSPRAIAVLVRVLYRRAVCVVGVSDDVVRDLVERHGVPRRSAVRIYNPLPRSASVEPAGDPSSDVAAPHPWLEPAPGRLRLVLAGGLREAKGHRVAIAAMAERPSTAGDWRLVCLGTGPLRLELEQLARQVGVDDRVAFVGHVPDPRHWMASADLVVIPSLWEGFGLVAVEAAMAGTPVVASEATGLRELVPRFVRGSRVPVGSASALASEFSRVAAGGGFQAPLETLDEFDPSLVARRYLLQLFDDRRSRRPRR